MRQGPPIRARSPSTLAVARLLRDLSDPGALVENELVRRAWRSVEGRAAASETVRAVRSAVEAALARLETYETGSAKRVGSILKRCDIDGEPHRAAMLALSISRPEFYRQLRAGRRAIAEAVAASSPAAPRAERMPRDPLEVRLQGAYSLALAGNADAAVRYLAPLLDALEGSRFVRVACALAEFRFDAGLELEGLAYLDAARRRAGSLRADGAIVAAAAIAQVEAAASLKRGGAFDLPALERHVVRLRSLPDAPVVADVRSMLLVLVAARAMFEGRLSEAWRVLRECPARDPQSAVLPRTRADALALSVGLEMRLPGLIDDAGADCEEAYRFAVRHGMHGFATGALTDRARISALRGDFVDARFYADEASASSSALNAPWLHAGACSVAALVALATRRSRSALELSREARRHCAPTAYPALVATLYEAEALRLEFRYEESYLVGRTLRERLGTDPPPQLLAHARRLEGETLLALGRGRRGRAALVESRAILRECEYPGDYVAVIRARDARER